MCRPRVSPMVPIIAAEFPATGRAATRTFQTLSAGRTGQAGAPGSVGDTPEPGVGVGCG